jgi:hypothetical protein
MLVGTAAPAGASLTKPQDVERASFTWVQVCDWSGGGKGNDQRHSDAFTLIGGQQFFSVSTKAVPGPYSIPLAGWSVESVDGNGGFDMFYPRGMGLSHTDMFLPAGTYYVWSNTLDCWWSLGMWESRPTVSITGFTPTSAPVGATVTITGTGFIGNTVVAFHGSAATFNVVSATQIQATVPATATTGKIAVQAPGGSVESAGIFTVMLPPRLTSFTPASGVVGTPVTLTGAEFTGATRVAFNGTPAPGFVVQSPTRILVNVPSGATTGAIAVTSPAGTAGSPTSFEVIPPPTVTSFSPTSGLVGTTVTLTGTAFAGAAAVAFGGVQATSFRVDSPTQITVTVPDGAASGPIAVTGPTGTGTSAAPFTAMFAPTVTLGLSGPKSGAMNLGKTVTATGKVTPSSLAGRTVTLTVQVKMFGRWVKAKTGSATISSRATYTWKYKPAKKGAYRMQATIAARATNTAATTVWLTFKVR